jgi:hypothetical protein
MSARYGSRVRGGEPVGNFNRRAGGGGGAVEVTHSTSPAPASSSAPYTVGGVEYIVATITSNTTVSFVGPATATGEALVVSGGGGVNVAYNGGGGGGGATVKPFLLSSGPWPVVIGAGSSSNGSPSSGFGITTKGGSCNSTPFVGGSGGAVRTLGPSSTEITGNPGTVGQGFEGGGNAGSLGGAGGGGAGGAGEANNNRQSPGGTQSARYEGGNGGKGYRINWTGTDVEYGGGGGGGLDAPYINSYIPGGGAVGTASGGGAPGTTGALSNGTANTGGGGGDPWGSTGSSGGSGVVIFRYQRYQG